MASAMSVKSALFIVIGIIIRALMNHPLTSLGLADKKETKKKSDFSWKVTVRMSDIAAFLFSSVVWFGIIYVMSALIIKPLYTKMNSSVDVTESVAASRGFLKEMTNPLTSMIIQMDEIAVDGFSKGHADHSVSMIKHVCSDNQHNRRQCVHLFEWVSRADGGGCSDVSVGFMLFLVSSSGALLCLYLADKLVRSAWQQRIAAALKVIICEKLTNFLRMFSGDVIVPVISGLLVLVSESYSVALIGTLLAGFAAVYVKRMYHPLQRRSIEIPLIGRFHDTDGKMGVVAQMVVCQTVSVALWYPNAFAY